MDDVTQGNRKGTRRVDLMCVPRKYLYTSYVTRRYAVFLGKVILERTCVVRGTCCEETFCRCITKGFYLAVKVNGDWDDV